MNYTENHEQSLNTSEQIQLFIKLYTQLGNFNYEYTYTERNSSQPCNYNQQNSNVDHVHDHGTLNFRITTEAVNPSKAVKIISIRLNNGKETANLRMPDTQIEIDDYLNQNSDSSVATSDNVNWVNTLNNRRQELKTSP